RTVDQTIDANGLVALPGLVDLHTHLREPGREDAETIASGSAAAAIGGFTAILAMANTTPVTDTAEAAERILDLGRLSGLVDVQPVGAVTKGLAGEELAELGLMARSRARVRVFSDDGRCVADARVMRRALEYIRAFGGVVSEHSQDPKLADHKACCHEGELSGRLGLPGWPSVAEEVIVARDVMLARHTGSRVHIAHVSTAGSVEVIRWAKAQGISVTAEVTPHHLMLTTDLLVGYDPTFKVNPPLRPIEDVEALRGALADGTIDAVATDHAPHARHDKEHTFDNAAFGMLGLETALSVVSDVMVGSDRLDWAGVARVMSVQPARIAGLAGHGRPIAVGEPANLTLVDPSAVVTVDREASVSLSRNNPWHGRRLTGSVQATLLRGVPTVLKGALV
ncbi:MAG TPA: dihydroorotase, partial [Dermatophilaceae bacterium]